MTIRNSIGKGMKIAGGIVAAAGGIGFFGSMPAIIVAGVRRDVAPSNDAGPADTLDYLAIGSIITMMISGGISCFGVLIYSLGERLRDKEVENNSVHLTTP